MAYLEFWGKAQPLEESSATFHPIAYHSLDVAATGQVLLESVGLWRTRLASLLDLDDAATVSLVTFLLALHDVGKFSKPFQAKVPSLWPASTLGAFDGQILATPYHDTAGWMLWDSYLSDKLGNMLITPCALHPMVRAVTGHHGAPPEEDAGGSVRSIFGVLGRKEATAFALDASALLLKQPIEVVASEENINTASYALAGITTLADWIGSNQEWFRYHLPCLSLAEYWEKIALPNARNAIPQAGLSPKSSARHVSYRALAGIAEDKPFSASPMQDWAAKVELPAGPSFFIIEDMTGAGKTETAMMLAHRLMAAGKADGLFLALPTQATANAMYERLAKAYRALFDGEDAPSLILAHGARDLHEGFSQSILNFATGNNADGTTTPASEITASSQCAQWVADDRRLAFLADVGVGTVDQALLAILPNRHQGLRLAGLMRRVLILDEIHAYDAYMQEEICALISFHASLGGATILLSATLPHNMKDRLCAAFADGRGDAGSSGQAAAPYPLMTYWAGNRFKTHAAAPRRESVRQVPVRFLGSPDEAIDIARKAAQEGQAVLYIRNSVDYAIEAFERLKADVRHTTLLHARYALCDRIAQENRVLASFGKNSGPDQRAGRLLVATQVVEQSLDLDFDLVISDLAPIDLLIQRAGRLWRHQRPDRPGRCEFMVVTPDPVDEPDKDWFIQMFSKSGKVYPNHAQLWLAARILQSEGAIKSPDNLRTVIESVYGEAAEDDLPPGLSESFYESEGSDGAARGLGRMNVLKLSAGYARDGGLWETDERTPTRLGMETVTLRLATMEDGRVKPWGAAAANENAPPWRAWRLSEASVFGYLASGEAEFPARFKASIATAKESWTRWDQHKILVILEQGSDNFWRGKVMTEHGPHALVYSPSQGLTFPKGAL